MTLRISSPAGSPRVSLDRNDPSYSTPTTPIPRSLAKSTPRALTVKPPPFRSRAKNQTEDDISVQSLSQPNDQILDTCDDPFLMPPRELRQVSPCPRSHMEDLPQEILEGIIGHVVGHLGSTLSDPSGSQHAVRNWNAIMRHPRRKKVADLALVSYMWRRLIQERVYRHIKIQGTASALHECGEWFLRNPHLQGYVRHFEVLMPIWEMKPERLQPLAASTDQRQDSHGRTLLRTFQGLGVNSNLVGDIMDVTAAFRLASKNATLDDIFGCAQVLFPDLCALTIEGGHCKRPPKIQFFRQKISSQLSRHSERNPLKRAFIPAENWSESDSRILKLSMPAFRNAQGRPVSLPAPKIHPYFPQPMKTTTPRLPTLTHTKTLIIKGAWNMIRTHDDFKTLIAALPSLREFHCTYHKPKTMAYASICDSLKADFPATITHLNLCLEGLYTKTPSSLKKWRKLYPTHHICRHLGTAAPRLESLTYTGRVCGALFSAAIVAADQHSCPRLKSIDIVVNNVCRDPNSHNDGTGIHNWPFIQAFEVLVIQAVRSLRFYTSVHNMRIRFIDLDSPAPLLNPMFHLDGDRAWGIYSDEILRILAESRPDVRVGNLPGEPGWDGELGLQGQAVQQCHLTGKHRVISVAYYKAMAHAGGLM